MYDPTDTPEIIQTKRDKYWVYIDGTWNPWRAGKGMKKIPRDIADECFKIIYDFEKRMSERRKEWETERA